MTVSYQYDVASSSSGGFTRLLFKWKGSVYKLVWRELLWFSFAYTLLSVMYRNVLTEDQKRHFERVADYFDKFLGHIPLSFVLGVYVTLVVQRWWSQFLAIPWPDNVPQLLVLDHSQLLAPPLDESSVTFSEANPSLSWLIHDTKGPTVTGESGHCHTCFAWNLQLPSSNFILIIAFNVFQIWLCHCIALYVTGHDEQSRLVRRTIARYMNLSLVLVLRSISMAVKKRFPTLQHLVEGGFMTKAELDIYQSVPSSEFNTYWIPCTWVINLIKDAKKGKMIVDNQGLKLLLEEFNEFRSKCGLLWSYDWVSIPLVYTQVVTLATYSFFAACVIGRQYVDAITDDDKLKHVDLYIPIFTFLQFFFYMGLLKVAEALINPFGDDDEDFELNWMIDRHLKVSYLVVDTLLTRMPPLVRDAHYDELEPTLTYTKAAMMYKKKTFRGSVAAVLVPEDEQTLVLPEIVEEDEELQEHSSDLSMNKTSNSILNLLTWTATTGSKMISHKKSSVEEIRIPKSASLPEDTLSAMESGHLHPPMEHLPAVAAARYPPSAGIRGRFLSTSFGSSEVVLQNKKLVAERPLSSKEGRPGGKFIRGDSGESASTSSSHPDIGPVNSSPTSSISVSSKKTRKSKSLDMGQVKSSESEDCVSQHANNRNRSKSCAAKLRYLKRKYHKNKQSPLTSSTPPARGRHRFWASKESLQKPTNADVPGECTTIEDPVSVPAGGGVMSLSLPSIHIAGADPDSCDEDDELELPKLISIYATKNGAENKMGTFNIGKYSPSVPKKTFAKTHVLDGSHSAFGLQRITDPDDQPASQK